MNLKFCIAALVCKVLAFGANLLGGGTDSPGRIALKLYPAVLRQLRYDGKIIAVTGSNGKTTTSNLIAHVLRQQGYSVINNEKGSNLTPGIATTLLCGATLGGRRVFSAAPGRQPLLWPGPLRADGTAVRRRYRF